MRHVLCLPLLLLIGCGSDLEVRSRDRASWVSIECGQRARAARAREHAALRDYASEIARLRAHAGDSLGFRLIRYRQALSDWNGVKSIIVDDVCRNGVQAYTNDFPSVGAPAPAFELPHLFDPSTHVRLADITSDIVVVNFWATWCGPCRAEYPTLLRIARMYAPHVSVIHIASQDTGQAPVLWSREHGSDPIIQLRDDRVSLWKEYLIDGLPTNYVLDRDHRILAACDSCSNRFKSLDAFEDYLKARYSTERSTTSSHPDSGSADRRRSRHLPQKPGM